MTADHLKASFVEAILKRYKIKTMDKAMLTRLTAHFKAHPSRGEVYVAGGRLFHERGAADSFAADTVRYTRQEVEAMDAKAKAPKEKPAPDKGEEADTAAGVTAEAPAAGSDEPSDAEEE